MQLKKLNIIAIAFTMTMPGRATADELNLTNELTKALFYGKDTIPFPGTPSSFCKQDGTAIGNPFLSLFTCVYYFNNIRTTPIDVTYSAVKQPAIPTTIVSKPFYYKNCTPDPYPVNDTLSVSTMEGASLTTTTTIMEGSSATLATNITIPVKGVQLGINDSKSASYSKTVGENTTTSYQSQTTVTQQLTGVTIQPMTLRLINLEKTLTTGYIDFDGTVSVEADVSMTIRSKSDGKLSNMVSIGNLTSFTPTLDGRTLHLKGQVWNVKGEKVERKDKITSLKDDPKLCEDSAVQITNAATRMFALTTSAPRPLSVADGFPGGVLTTAPVINGMQIETANAVATVNVRAKGMGPGYCATNVSGGGQTVAVAAPPFVWSPWQPLFNHIGAVSATINTTIICDTGAVFEIQYYK